MNHSYFLTWSPRENESDPRAWLGNLVQGLGFEHSIRDRWSTGLRKDIPLGSRVYLLRQGRELPGLVASGVVVDNLPQQTHWSPSKEKRGLKANYVNVEWQQAVPLEHGLARADLLTVVPKSRVDAQSSGTILDERITSRLAALWKRHLAHHSDSRSDETSLHLLNDGAARTDTFDDLDDDTSLEVGSDNPARTTSLRSNVARDPRVRRRVLKRSKLRCERPGCEASRAYPAFLDVHHILTAEKSDRVWTCVALCPNCHREAHFAPDRDTINRQLQQFAEKFRR